MTSPRWYSDFVQDRNSGGNTRAYLVIDSSWLICAYQAKALYSICSTNRQIILTENILTEPIDDVTFDLAP